jgi:hypothetical protein
METSGRGRKLGCAGPAVALAVLALAVVVSGCGAEGNGAEAPRAIAEARATQSVGIDGVSIDLPAGWDTYTTRIGPDETVAVIWAASRRFAESSPRPEFPHETLTGLPEDGIAVEIVAQPPQVDSASWPLLAPPISLADGYFLADAYEGQPAPHVSTQIIEARMAGRALYVQVYFGRNQPDDTMRAWANRVLASLAVSASAAVRPREVREDGFVRFEDPEVGVSGRYPDGWHRARALTNLVLPREVLALATFPLRGGAKAGECAPDRARADMPPGGAFIWLVEYRPPRGDVWADLPRDRFPPRPGRFEIRPGDLAEGVSCFRGPGLSTTFRAADRPFQVLIAFGGQPTDKRLAEVEAILDSLRFEELPSPPPDPYAGWPPINDTPGDSLRPPPGWPAAASMFPPDKTPRPRPLFFASNHPLAGLPAKLVPYVEGLPGPWPSAALDAFPANGVLLWVLEQEKGEASAEFPPIGRGWPSRDDFRPADVLTEPAPDARWLRAGGSFRGYRFSVWVGAGPEASGAEVALALKGAASLAVSGCWRDVIDDCPDR